MERINSNECLTKEIDLIQSCISRMANNSFLIKGWLITLLTVFLAFLKPDFKCHIWVIALISFGILFGFWYLDGLFLKAERLYIKKYNWVIEARMVGNMDYLYNLDPNNTHMWLPKEKNVSVLQCMFSKTLIPFYGIIFIILLAIIIFGG